MSSPGLPARDSFAGRLATAFTGSRLTPLAILASLLLGLFAVIMLPREEEPQIKVPMIDVLVAMPGATAHEVENRVTRPLEKFLWEIPGVEYLYSTSRPGQSVVIVRFIVGSDLEEALVRLNKQLASHADRIPQGASAPLVKPRTIDDVPVAALTLHSHTHDHFSLRRLAAQLEDEIKSLPEIADTTLIGGLRRQLRIQIDPARLAARRLSIDDVARSLQSANSRSQAGSLSTANSEVLIEAGDFLRDANDASGVTLGVADGRPIFLRDVADILEGPAEPADYVLFGSPRGEEEAAVTLSIAKRPGSNAIRVVREIEATVHRLQGVLLPNDVTVSVTRNYGATASEKSNELLFHMGIAVFGVAVLIRAF
ncbi:MAG TPA: efflux RND transporter permease subunit, partial [Opitutaceae bacterium]|nr:efflux RND transporter permease subunit [Opitutaceae bacterium]